jgi:hypothetical protein
MKRIALVVVAPLVAGAAVWLYFSERGAAPGAGDATPSRAWSRLDLPPVPEAGFTELRKKTRAGHDRFLVEVYEEEIASRLARLRTFFANPKDSGPLAELLARGFSSSALQPRDLQRLHAADGVEVAAGRGLEGDLDAAGFAAAVRDLIRPLEELERVELKVFHIEAPGDPTASGDVSARLRYLLGGRMGESTAAGARHQWHGEALLSWSQSDWRLLAWKTLDWFHTRFDEPPFEDASEEALGSIASYREILRPSLDVFRARLDAATGIDVYGHHGIAAGDADGDGIDDLYIPTAPGLPNLLFLGRGDGSFEDASARSGADVLEGTSQALFLDVDNDGDQDLFLVTERGPAVLLNHGLGRFDPSSEAIALGPLGNGTPLGAAAADYDGDGLVDVYLTAYVFWRSGTNAAGTRQPIPYHEARNGAPNVLLRNLGGGRFEDATERAGLNADNSRFSFAAAWADYDDDGDPDIYVANDFGSNNLFQNHGDGTFSEAAPQAGVSDPGPGMSAAWEDYDGDGHLDLYVGNMFSAAGRRVTGIPDYRSGEPEVQSVIRRHPRGNSLFRNRGDGAFDDASVPSRAFFGRWAWASGFLDFNLDGREDLLVQNGFVTGPDAHDL